MLAEGLQWFDRFLRGVRNGIETRPAVVLADEGRRTARRLGRLPRRIAGASSFAVRRTIAAGGKVLVRSRPLARAAEVFGPPVVRVTATAAGGWSRLVAVLVARTPAGRQIVVSAGGVPLQPGRRTYAISLVDQATSVPKGSRWEVTLGSSTLAQSKGNLLYLELPMPPAARLTVGRVDLRVPVLR
jgi:predicted acyl esterase